MPQADPLYRPSVVVANPGAMRWMRPVATAFSDAGLLRAYITPVLAGSLSRRLASALPGRLGAVPRALLLRPAPEHVAAHQLFRAATLTELVSVGAVRAGAPRSVSERLLDLRGARFDRAVGRLLEPGDRALIGLSTVSASSFARAAELGLRAVLDHPTVHHEWSERLIAHEARLVPDYAFSLQTVAASRARRASAEAELRLADRILVNSDFALQTFLESGVAEERMIEVPFGVELEAFAPETDSASLNGRFRVLFVGQITQRKGLSYLIDGFRAAHIDNSELVLVGRLVGDRRPWSADGNILDRGPIPHHALPALYRSADVFVLPSLFEGFAQTALEAMASGLPVIVSEHTFGRGVITDGVDGFVVPIRDSAAIAERLRMLHADQDLRHRVGLAARRRAEQFSWRRYGEGVVAAVAALAEG